MKPLVVLTSFEPFDRRTQNGSDLVASEVLQLSLNCDFDLHWIRHVPVVYDEGAAFILKAIDDLDRPPLFVLSLGEGGSDIRIEVCANNCDKTSMPDNRRTIRSGARIAAELPDRLGFAFPVWEWMDLILDKSGVRLSISPGNFVCNNASFLLSLELERRRLPFTFIHVPRADRPSEVSREETARLIVKLIKRACQVLSDVPNRILISPPEIERELLIEGRESMTGRFYSRILVLLSDSKTPQF